MGVRLISKGSLMAMLLLAGCSANSPVQMSYNENVDFSRYKTFGVEAVQSDQQFSFINGLIDTAITKNLQAKGMQPAVGAAPDLMVRFATEVKNVSSVNMEYIPTDDGVFTRYTPDTATQGKLLVNMLDPASKQVVWKAVTIREVSPDGNVTQEKVDTVVNQVLEDFPPP